MESENQRFQVRIETGEIMEAELLSIVEIDEKKYAVYSLENENGTVDILASYVTKTIDGYDKLIDIDNPFDKEKISEFVQNLVTD